MKLTFLLAHLLVLQIVFAQTSETASRQPNLNIDFADPTVINVHGTYYAYATQAKHNGSIENIQLAVSPDLQYWRYVGDVLPQKPAWASHTQDFWAPHVLYDASLQKYVLFFSARSNDTAYDKCIGVAFATKPEGPFIPEAQPLVSGEGFVNIDPMAIIDPVTKKKYLFWGSGFKPIRVEEMTTDWKHFVKGSHAKEVAFPHTEKKIYNAD